MSGDKEIDGPRAIMPAIGTMKSGGRLEQGGNAESVLLIIGFPRSGTKLLRKLLNRHDRIFVTEELMFLTYLINRWDSYGDLSNPENFASMYEEIMRTHYFAVREAQGMPLIGKDEWYAQCKSFDALGLFLPIIRHEMHAPEDPGIWLGDKSPNYTTHIGEIRRAIPQAKVIHIVRDVRDAALSARRAWNKNIFRFAQRWSDGLRILQRDVADTGPGEFLEIRYEDLLTDPALTLTRATDYLGLPFSDKMLHLDRPSENHGDAKGSLEILPGNAWKYKTQMTSRERQTMEAICADELRRYGYECGENTVSRRLSRLRMAWYLALDVYNRLLFDLKLGRGLGFISRSMAGKARMRL